MRNRDSVHDLNRCLPASSMSSNTRFPEHLLANRQHYDRLLCCCLILQLATIPQVYALHHMKRAPIAYVAQRDESKPLVVMNLCRETIYPGIATQSGHAPSTGGFKLDTGDMKNLTVGADWQGRVWGRTNCSFNGDGTGASNAGGNNGGGSACATGDCNGIVDCKVTVSKTHSIRKGALKMDQGNTPVSLAEFTLASSSGQTFYDISLVDGYNLPLAIISLYPESGNTSLTKIPPNLTNPICIGTASLLADQGSTADAHSGTNDSFPIPLEESQSRSDVQRWCPWDLQLSLPTKPADGVYSYPDDKIQRPLFNPCFSACAKYDKPSDCCTGGYDSPNVCKPSQYSQDAKKVCPDAYSFGMSCPLYPLFTPCLLPLHCTESLALPLEIPRQQSFINSIKH